MQQILTTSKQELYSVLNSQEYFMMAIVLSLLIISVTILNACSKLLPFDFIFYPLSLIYHRVITNYLNYANHLIQNNKH